MKNHLLSYARISIISIGLGLLTSNFWFKVDNACLDTSRNINLSILFAGSFALIACLLYNSIKKKEIVAYLIYTSLKYLLVYFILVYAIPQIYGIQYSSSYFMQHESLADLKPRQLMYLFFAHNPGYQKVLGWTIFLGSLFLCFRKYNLAGVLILGAVFSNVVFLNIFYEACQTLPSAIFLIGLLGLATYHYRRLAALFNPNLSVEKTTHPLLETSSQFYKGLVIMKAIFFIGYTSYLNTRSYNFVNSWWNIESPIIQGVWQLDEIETDNEPLPEFKYFFFEKGRRGIVKTENDSISGFQYIIDTSYHQLEFWNFHEYRALDFKGKYELIDTNTLRFSGTNRKDSLSFVMSKIKQNGD